MNVKIQRKERLLIDIPPEKEMSEADITDWINGKAKGNLKVVGVVKLTARKHEVVVWRALDDYPDTIKAM